MNNKNYAEIAKAISEPIGLTKHLVAVKLFDDLKQVPEGLPRPESKIYYCGAVGQAMQGKTLLLLAEDHGCDRGAYMLGVKEPPETVVNGEMYAKSHMVETARAGKRLIDQAPKIPVGKTAAILLTPLEEATFDPDVVLVAANPHQSLVILNATNYKNGLEIPLRFQILTSFCAYATVLPFKYGKPEATVPQEQARMRSQFTNEEMLIGIPGEMLETVAQVLSGLCCVPKPAV
jgi:uncharacterized protein (DUF169 family)